MAMTYVPLKSSLIDEGEFSQNVDIELASIQKALLDFVRQHKEKALGATAKLSIDIVLKVHSVEANAYTITTSMKSSVPKRPASMSIAIGGTDVDDAGQMYVRDTGSDRDHPQQGKLFKTLGNDQE